MQKNQNVFLFYVRVLLYCLVALLIRARRWLRWRRCLFSRRIPSGGGCGWSPR